MCVCVCVCACVCVCVCVCAGYMEKYWETKRELETLRQRLSTEKDDELETLRTSKRSLEKKVWGV